MTPPNYSSEPPRRPLQFDLNTLLWLMVTIGIALTYLRQFGVEAILRGVLVVSGSLLVAAPVGLLARRLGDTLFWAVLGAAFAYTSTVGVPVQHWSASYAWAAVGATTGTAIGAWAAARPLHTMLVGGVVGLATLGSYGLGLFLSLRVVITFDLVCAPLAGALFGALVEVFFWLERRASLRRYLTAAALMLFVAIGNYLARLAGY